MFSTVSVPKFALESTTASLPTFQSAQQQGGRSSSMASHKTEPSQHTEASTSGSKKRRGHACIVCGHPNYKCHTYLGQYGCQSCIRFFYRKTEKLIGTGQQLICSNGGKMNPYCLSHMKCLLFVFANVHIVETLYVLL